MISYTGWSPLQWRRFYSGAATLSEVKGRWRVACPMSGKLSLIELAVVQVVTWNGESFRWYEFFGCPLSTVVVGIFRTFVNHMRGCTINKHEYNDYGKCRITGNSVRRETWESRSIAVGQGTVFVLDLLQGLYAKCQCIVQGYACQRETYRSRLNGRF